MSVSKSAKVPDNGPGTPGGPTFAHIYVENRCHLKCDHCYESEESHPPVRGLSLDDYDTLFEDLAALGVFVITFSGGEPFLRKDFIDIVALARRHRFAVRIYTSGTLINESVATRLAELRVQEVHISLYSHRAEVHDKFTASPGSHDKSVRGLKLLRDQSIRTVLKSCVMTINIDELVELKDLAHAVGAEPRFDPGIKPKMDGDQSPLKYALSPEEIAEKFLDVPELVETWGAKDLDGLCDGENPRRGRDVNLCAAATSLIAIGADGSVSPCAMFPRSAGRYTEGLGRLWRASPIFQQVRGQRFDGMKECTSCEVASTCDPCMAYGVVEHDDRAACNTSSKRAATSLLQLNRRREARSLNVLDQPDERSVSVG